jgi:hypothetical protein
VLKTVGASTGSTILNPIVERGSGGGGRTGGASLLS